MVEDADVFEEEEDEHDIRLEDASVVFAGGGNIAAMKSEEEPDVVSPFSVEVELMMDECGNEGKGSDKCFVRKRS